MECLFKNIRHDKSSSAALGDKKKKNPPGLHLLEVFLTSLEPDFLLMGRTNSLKGLEVRFRGRGFS